MLIYSAIVSLDGYTADQEGEFDWGEPDEEVLGLINDLERPVGTYLYGRGMYEVLRYWEDADLAGRSAATRDQLFVTPVIVGGGLPALPLGARASLHLVDERRFASGVVYLCYRPQS